MDLRLNLGCGAKRLDGYVNVDKFGNPDLNFDLETFPYPWENNTVTDIEMHHVLEHLGQKTDIYLKIIQELYRICQPKAKIHITSMSLILTCIKRPRSPTSPRSRGSSNPLELLT